LYSLWCNKYFFCCCCCLILSITSYELNFHFQIKGQNHTKNVHEKKNNKYFAPIYDCSKNIVVYTERYKWKYTYTNENINTFIYGIQWDYNKYTSHMLQFDGNSLKCIFILKFYNGVISKYKTYWYTL
jgi:hypothetical protein